MLNFSFLNTILTIKNIFYKAIQNTNTFIIYIHVHTNRSKKHSHNPDDNILYNTVKKTSSKQRPSFFYCLKHS